MEVLCAKMRLVWFDGRSSASLAATWPCGSERMMVNASCPMVMTLPPLSRTRKLSTRSRAATWKWRARAETAGTIINVGNLAIAVLQLEATPTAARRRYMAIAA